MYCRLSVNTQLLANVQQLMKISKANFTPPPKVESRIVRIEPKIPPPPIEFKEWDGLVRLCFSRKNKTLNAIFKQKTIYKLIEDNMKTLYSLQNKEWNEIDVKSVINSVLEKNEFGSMRSSKMEIDTFMKYNFYII